MIIFLILMRILGFNLHGKLLKCFKKLNACINSAVCRCIIAMYAINVNQPCNKTRLPTLCYTVFEVFFFE